MSEKDSELGSEYTNDTGSVVRSDMGVEGESIGANRSGLETESDSEVFARLATRDAAKKRKSKGDGEKKAMVSPRPPTQTYPYIFHFSFRPNWKQKWSKGSNRKLLEGLTSSNSDWKSSFIFVPNVVAGQTYATTAFVETHSVPPVASSKEISGRILAALKVVDLSFDTIVGRKKRSVSGDPGRNRVTVINAAALRVKTKIVKPFVEPDGADDAPFDFIRSYQSPGGSASGPKEKKQNSPIGAGVGGSLVGSSKPAWLAPMETELENLAVSPDWLGSLPVGISETLALAQQQALLAGLTVNECKRRIDEELLRLIDHSTRSSEEAACWKEKFDRLNGEYLKLLDREAALQKELDASKHSEMALRVKVDSQDEQLEELREKVTELRAGIGLDRAAVFNSESWSGLMKRMEEHYVSGVIDNVMTHCDGDIDKYRGWLEDRAKEVSAEDGTAELSTTADAARAPSST
ncbi:hypothetical protein C2S52_019497 [Perilla frutescens var. hirtella]|nr:hypothetical protein C2S52_019497 [Perilla frutescens var. hirtella]